MCGTAVITGAAGFVGSALTGTLLGDGWTIIGVDSFDDYYDPRLKRGNVSALHNGGRFFLLENDVRDSATLHHRLDRLPIGDIDVVVHAAALAGVRASRNKPAAFRRVNVGGSAGVVELVKTRSIPHLVLLSSSSVYGINPDVPWTEDATPQPVSVYAESKLAAERLVAFEAAAHGFSAVAARLFTVYGPGQRPDLAITNFASRMIRGRPIRVFGDGTALRDFTHIDDIVAGLRAAMGHAGRPFEVFNLARGVQFELRHIVAALEDLLGIEATIDHHHPVQGDVPQTWGSIDKSRRELGYRPTVELTTGLESALPWFHQVAELERAADVVAL